MMTTTTIAALGPSPGLVRDSRKRVLTLSSEEKARAIINHCRVETSDKKALESLRIWVTTSLEQEKEKERERCIEAVKECPMINVRQREDIIKRVQESR